jgi:adenylate cyclase
MTFLKKRFAHPSLKNIILRQVTTVFVICLLILSLYGWYQQKRAVHDFAKNLAAQHSLNIAQKLEKKITENISLTNFFNVWLSHELSFTQKTSSPTLPSNKDFFKFISASLKNVDGISAIYVGDLKGNFKQLRTNTAYTAFQYNAKKKLPLNAEFTLRTLVHSSTNIAKEKWMYINENGKILAQETIEMATYDPRKRPWFQNAVQFKKSHLSQVYQYGSIRNLVMTLSIPLMYEGKVHGVLGVDFDVRALSLFLQSHNPISKGAFFIVDEKNYIIASSDPNHPMTQLDGRARIVDYEEIEHSPPLFSIMEEKKKNQSDTFLYTHEGIDFNIAFTPFGDYFQRMTEKKWSLLTILPHASLMGPFLEQQGYNIIIYIFIYTLVLGQIVILARSISDPVDEITQEARRIQKFDFSTPFSVDSPIKEVQVLGKTIETMKLSLRSFTRYMPKRLVQRLLEKNEDLRLGGDMKNLTILFSDIAGFTTVSEKMGPQALMLHLSDYFENLTTLILNEQGTIDKYIGDAIMAFWGAPDDFENKSHAACRSALLCQNALKILNDKWLLEKKPPLPTRIGLHNGDVVVGNMGSSERMNYTAIGDAVNMAARLEGINKYYDTSILISESVYEEVKEVFLCRSLDIVAVKGKEKGVRIYELLGVFNDPDLDPPTEKIIHFSETFSKAHDFYLRMNFKEALDIFKAIPYPHSTIDMYIERCEHYMQNPPESSAWNGIHRFTSK